MNKLKNRLLICFILISTILAPISAYADVTELVPTANNASAVNNTEVVAVSENNNNSEPELIYEYNPLEQAVLDTTPEIGCQAAYIAEPITGKVFYEKNAHVRMYPASTTKALTALITFERCKLTDTVIVSQHAIDLIPEGYSDAGLRAGEELTVKDLLYALMLPSANEAANALAEHISGSIEAFAELSNQRAKELGCEDLHFVNPNGIHDNNHYCTAYDLYLIAKECQKYDAFNEIVKTQYYTLPATAVYPYNNRELENTNELILPTKVDYYYPYCTGIKTGFTTPAGNCLIASSSFNNVNLISVVLGGGTNSLGLNERFFDTTQLFDFVYNNYSIQEVVPKDYLVAKVSVNKAVPDSATLDVITNSDITTIAPNNTSVDNVIKTVEIDDNITAPIKEGQTLGKITFRIDGLNYTTKIIASNSVERFPYEIVNYIVVGAIVLFVVSFIVVLILFTKHKWIVVRIILIIIMVGCVVVIVLGKYQVDKTITPAKNVTEEKKQEAIT